MLDKSNKQGDPGENTVDRTNRINKSYEAYFSLYYGNNDAPYLQSLVAEKIKELLSGGILPDDSELKYSLGKFLYREMIPDTEWMAIQLLEDASSGGVSEADELLHTITETYRAEAKKGDVHSQSILGRCLALRNPHSRTAGDWLEKAAAQKDSEAELWLSACYLSGLCGRKKNVKSAVTYANKAYCHGNDLAAYNLGCFFADGTCCVKDMNTAEKYWKIALEAGHPQAAAALEKLHTGNTSGSSSDGSITLLISMAKDQKELKEAAKTTENNTNCKLDKMEQNSEQRHQENSRIVAEENEKTRQLIEALAKDMNSRFDQMEQTSEIRHQEDIRITAEEAEKTRQVIDDRADALEKIINKIPERVFNSISEQLNSVTEKYRESLLQFESLHRDLTSKIEGLTEQIEHFFAEMEQQSVKAAEASECEELKACHTEDLKRIFGDYWYNGQLLDSSKESLIAARVLLSCAGRHHLMDCRGIVISATSALEREMKARFYTGLRGYLMSAKDENGARFYPYFRQLPKKLKMRYDKLVGQWVDNFTMNDVYYIVYPRNVNGGIETDKPETEIALTRAYLKTILSTGYDCDPAENAFLQPLPGKTQSYCSSINEIASKYRNRAAHAEDIDGQLAQKCCQEVIGEAGEDIHQIEGILLELLKMTGKFTHSC